MGLDMYLYIRHNEYSSIHSPNKNIELEYTKFMKQHGPNLPTPISASVKTTYEVGYWRKANAIHRWFIENCAPRDGAGDTVDDCRPVAVDVDQLELLLDACKQIKDNHKLAPTLLPTQKGFFFGPTEYDEWYFDHIDSTIKIIEPVIEFMNNIETDDTSDEYYTIIYEASW